MLTRYGLINKSQESRVKSQESRRYSFEVDIFSYFNKRHSFKNVFYYCDLKFLGV